MEIKGSLSPYPPARDNILLILHWLQDRNPRNYLSPKDLELTAAYLNTTLASVYGVASYYSMFSLKPRGRHVIRVCRSPVCHMMAAQELLHELVDNLGIDPGHTTADGLFTLERTECIGRCDQAPAMMIDQAVYLNMTGGRVGVVIDRIRQVERADGLKG